MYVCVLCVLHSATHIHHAGTYISPFMYLQSFLDHHTQQKSDHQSYLVVRERFYKPMHVHHDPGRDAGSRSVGWGKERHACEITAVHWCAAVRSRHAVCPQGHTHPGCREKPCVRRAQAAFLCCCELSSPRIPSPALFSLFVFVEQDE